MTSNPNMVSGELLSSAEAQFKSAWRFRWLGVLAASFIYLAGWIAVGLQSDVFEASARVYIDTSSETRKILGDQVVESSLSDHLTFVRQALLGRVQLEKVVAETRLGRQVVSSEGMDALIDGLRAQIGIVDESEISRRPPAFRNASTGKTYTISYQYPDRELAEDVVAVLLDSFLEVSLGGQTLSSAEARSFLEKQLIEYEGRLSQAEARLAEFNRKNYDKLPDMQGGYFARLQEEIAGLGEAKKQLYLAESRRERVEQQIRGEVPQVVSEIDPTSLEGRILENERRLDELSLRFTDSHPDVVATNEILAELHARLDEERATNPGGLTPGSNNPVYQALLISRNDAIEEIAGLQADVEGREVRVAGLQNLFNEMPAVEAELAKLNRDYEVVKTQYEELLVSLERERLSRDLLNTEQIDFSIIDPPSAGSDPVAPKRVFLMLAVIAAAYIAALGLPLLLGQLSPLVSNFAALRNISGVPVIGSVQYFETSTERKARILSYLALAGAYVVLALFGLSITLFEVLGPGLRIYV